MSEIIFNIVNILIQIVKTKKKILEHVLLKSDKMLEEQNDQNPNEDRIPQSLKRKNTGIDKIDVTLYAGIFIISLIIFLLNLKFSYFSKHFPNPK